MDSTPQKSASNNPAYYQVNSLAKGFRILEAVAAGGGLTGTEISRQIGLKRSTTNRFVYTLADLGFISADENGKYTTTLKLFELAQQNDMLNTVTLHARKYMLAEELGWALHPDIPRSQKQ